MSKVRHLWLMWMTEIAVARCHNYSSAMVRNWVKHANAAGEHDRPLNISRWFEVGERKTGTV